ALPPAGPASELVARLDEGDLEALPGQQRGRREPGDAPADDHGAPAHAPARPAATDARMPTFTGSGTDALVRRSCAAGVLRIRPLRCWYSAAAAAVARRDRGGRRAMATRATARSRAI